MRNTVKREILSFSSGKTVSFQKRLWNATFPYLAVSLKSAFSTHTSSWPFKLLLDVDLCCLTMVSCMSTHNLLGSPCCLMFSELQWAVNQGVSAAYLCFVFWFFFLILVEIIWYIAIICYLWASACTAPVLPATVIAAQSHLLSVPLYLPLQALPSFYFLLAFESFLSCQLTNHGLQDAIYQKYYTIDLIPPVWNLHLYQEFVVLHPLSYFFHQKHHIQREILSNLDCLIFRWISLFLALSCYWIPPELF